MNKWGVAVTIIVVIVIIAAIGAYFALNQGPQKTQKPKQIVIGVTDKISDLDPANSYDFFTWEIHQNTMNGLVKYKIGTTDIVPAIAKSWDVNQDASVWTFHLRNDVKFADGTPLKASNVVWSIKRVMRINGDPSWLVTDFVKDVTAVDDYTVQFTLKHPTAYFLSLLCTPPYFPVSPKYNPDQIDHDQTAGGAGPYMITKWVRDQEMDLETNPYYYGEKPKTSKIVIRFYQTASSMRLALQNGEINVAWRTLTPTDIKSLKEGGKYSVIEVPSAYIRYACLQTQDPPTSNKLVRQALAAAVDRKKIASVVFQDTVEPLYTMIPIGMWSHEDVFKEKYGEGPNLDLAKQLLTQAGYSETNKLKIQLWYTPTHYGDTEADLAQLLKEQWEATGMVEVTIKSAEWGTYLDYARNAEMQISLFGWYPDYLDPDDYTTPFLESPANNWAGTRYNNSHMNEILQEAQSLADQGKREQLYKEAQQMLAEDVPYIPLIQGKLYVVTDPNIKGVNIGPDMVFHYDLLYWTS